MKEKIESLRSQIESAMEEVETGRGLYELKVKFQTELKGIMSGMKDLAKEDRPVVGQLVNDARAAIETVLEEKKII